MLRFRILNISFFSLVILLGVYDYSNEVSSWIYLLLIIIYSSILFYATYYIDSQFFMRVICSGKTSANQVSITFDDGPHPGQTEKILDTLKRLNAKAAFFCIGNKIPGNEVLFRRITEEGHLVGNHSLTHDTWFDLFSSGKMKSELNQTNVIVKNTTGLQLRYFRPPYGVTNPNLAKAVKKAGLFPVGWNIRSFDTIIRNPDKLKSRIMNKLKPGSIILLHDTGKVTTEILDDLLRDIRSRNYEIVRLDALLNESAYA
jgi:peptidoglycan/xylan/chitin deacetylase (PgdA/CDA1 family)